MHSSWPGSFGSPSRSTYPSTCFHHSESVVGVGAVDGVCEMKEVMRRSLAGRGSPGFH